MMSNDERSSKNIPCLDYTRKLSYCGELSLAHTLFYFRLSFSLSLSDTIPTQVLDEDNAVYLLKKHKFPLAKWRDLAIGLKQIKAIRTIGADSGDALSQLVALIAHWMANDQEKSWKKLVHAVKMSEETVIAKKLAEDVGVPYPGAYIYF